MICFINFPPWGFILFFHLEHIPVSSRSSTLGAGFRALSEAATFLVCKERPRVDGLILQPCPGSWLSLRLCDRPAAYFIFRGSQWVRLRPALSASWREGRAQPALTQLTGSQPQAAALKEAHIRSPVGPRAEAARARPSGGAPCAAAANTRVPEERGSSRVRDTGKLWGQRGRQDGGAAPSGASAASARSRAELPSGGSSSQANKSFSERWEHILLSCVRRAVAGAACGELRLPWLDMSQLHGTQESNTPDPTPISGARDSRGVSSAAAKKAGPQTCGEAAFQEILAHFAWHRRAQGGTLWVRKKRKRKGKKKKKKKRMVPAGFSTTEEVREDGAHQPGAQRVSQQVPALQTHI